MNRFELCVYDPRLDDVAIPCRDFLARRAAGDIDWVPDREDSTFLLEADGREWIATDWNLGRMDLLVPQMEDCLLRLRTGDMGIIRSGVLDQFPVPYLLIEPPTPNSGLSRLSLFCITDSRVGGMFSIPRGGGSPETLFEYVRQNRERLLAEPGCRGFQQLGFPYDALLEALARESAAGRAVLELMNRPLPSPVP